MYDEFSHLLVADTLRHFRLANPPHALHQFFETSFVLQEPTYSSIYPLGQGLALSLGRAIFGHPWAGVILSTAAFCALCYWMLRGWTTPAWALAGGVLAVLEFGPLCYWMNSYWGGALAAAAGCLVFGALPRLRANGRTRDAVLLGAGLGLHLLTRPYESVFLLLSVVLFFLALTARGESRRTPKAYSTRTANHSSAVVEQAFSPALGPPYDFRHRLLRPPAHARGSESEPGACEPLPSRDRKGAVRIARIGAIVAAVALPALGITVLQNKQVTGSWTTLPYTLSQFQYGVPAALTIQAKVIPHRDLTPQQALVYEMQRSFSGDREDLTSFLQRLEYRVRFYRFFFLAPLYLVLPAFLVSLRERRFVWVVTTLTAFALGVNLFPAFQLHYVAAVTCLFVLVSVVGLQQLGRLKAGREAAQLILLLCGAQFLFWYGIHVADSAEALSPATEFDTWHSLDHGNARRIAVNRELALAPGRQLVFVRYSPQHIFQEEWVWNEADIDAARVVWARDLDPDENRKLLQYYPGRTAWLLEPDVRPPHLAPYRP